VSEHLHDRVGCKTVFATHYHELTRLADELPAVRNYNVGVREVGDTVLFLHRLQPGGADRSYGIEVGRLAGLPPAVLARARAVLGLLERKGAGMVVGLRAAGCEVGASGSSDATWPPEGVGPQPAARSRSPQLGLFGATPHPVVERLKHVEPDDLTPRQALDLVAELVEEARASG
jgi:DNA mismatch repair protein MutS